MEHVTQVEEHHLWCKFMDNPHGYAYGSYPSRFNLCFTCHKAIKQIIVFPILNEFARTLKINRSEYWLWKQIAEIDKPVVIKKVVEESYKFITDYSKEVTNGNTTKI
jgi:hypothetical protein